MDTLAIVDTLAAVVAAMGTVGTGIVAWWQLSAIAAQTRLQGEREKRWRTLEICARMDNDPILEEATKRIWDASAGGKNYDDIQTVQRDIIGLLNFLDSIAIGISQGFYVEAVARDHLESVFRKAAGEFLTDERARKIGLHKPDFTHLIELVGTWKPETKYKGGVQ